ncbi:hypothetical protein AB0L13_32075 [Saccharopolyspora shandongensis]
MPSIIMMPPTSADRSRPPVPMSCEIPPPRAWMRTLTSCEPVPEAATMPIVPGRTALAKQSPTLLMMAVPQSGPIISRPFWWARVFSSISSSTLTLSLNIITCTSFSSAVRASRAAYAPFTARTARFAFGSPAAAEAIVR